MRSHSHTSPLNSKARPAWPVRARCAVAAIALLTSAVALATPLPLQQLTVAFTNSFPNGSVNSLTMPNGAAIAATNPIFTGGTTKNIYTALTFLTNPATSTLDVIYADAEQHQIWRLAGPDYQTATLIFSWSGKRSGPPYPLGLAADALGNVYVISPSCAWDGPGVWVLPFTGTGTGWGTPQLIDNTFKDPVTGKPVQTLALTEVVVAGTAATPALGALNPAWNLNDVLVLVVDLFSTRVIRYSQAQIQSVLTAQSALSGPTSTVVTQAQFSTQAVSKIAPVAVGMDIGQDPNTQDVTLLFSSLFASGGKILTFDSAKNAFITPYAINLGPRLTRLRVGSYQGSQYVFVGQLLGQSSGQILEFAPPALPGTSNTKPLATVSKGVGKPSDLAVTYSGSTVTGISGSAGGCVNNPDTVGCYILPQLALDITGPGTVNIAANSTIVADGCQGLDPRVMIADGDPAYDSVPLDLRTVCSNLALLPVPVLLQDNVFGASGPTGTGLFVAKITSGLNQYNNETMTTPVNNTLTKFTVSPGLVLGTSPQCGNASYGPVVVWGPLPGVESNIPEGIGALIDMTVACVFTDPPPAATGGHPSIVVEGVALVGLNAQYIDGEFGNLSTVLSQLTDAGQIVDSGVVAAIQNYIFQSQASFDVGNYNCALNTLWNGVQYVNALVNNPATSGDFIALAPPGGDENPSGTLLMRFDHLYYDVNTFAGKPILTQDALSLPAASVPVCQD